MGKIPKNLQDLIVAINALCNNSSLSKKSTHNDVLNGIDSFINEDRDALDVVYENTFRSGNFDLVKGWKETSSSNYS